ncbi:MAG: sigma-70 family RNA polymerase sigma factor, partial [Novosphingobium sp.]
IVPDWSITRKTTDQTEQTAASKPLPTDRPPITSKSSASSKSPPCMQPIPCLRGLRASLVKEAKKLSVHYAGIFAMTDDGEKRLLHLVGWVGRHVLPHERDVRKWLRGAFPAIDVDDVIQEAYCRISELECVDHIEDPRRYFFRTARNIVLEQMRRERVVRIEAASGLIEMENGPVDEFSPERIVAGRSALRRVERLIEALPERARQVFFLRKIEGVSQREIAARLGLTENIVENEVARGLRRILSQMTEDERIDMPVRRRPPHSMRRTRKQS